VSNGRSASIEVSVLLSLFPLLFSELPILPVHTTQPVALFHRDSTRKSFRQLIHVASSTRTTSAGRDYMRCMENFLIRKRFDRFRLLSLFSIQSSRGRTVSIIRNTRRSLRRAWTTWSAELVQSTRAAWHAQALDSLAQRRCIDALETMEAYPPQRMRATVAYDKARKHLTLTLTITITLTLTTMTYDKARKHLTLILTLMTRLGST